jgi:hypothetical protein
MAKQVPDVRPPQAVDDKPTAAVPAKATDDKPSAAIPADNTGKNEHDGIGPS